MSWLKLVVLLLALLGLGHILAPVIVALVSVGQWILVPLAIAGLVALLFTMVRGFFLLRGRHWYW